MKRFFIGLKWVLAFIVFALIYSGLNELLWRYLPKCLPECISGFLGCIALVLVAPARRGWVAGAVASLVLFLLVAVVLILVDLPLYGSFGASFVNFVHHFPLADLFGIIIPGALGGHVGCKLKIIIHKKMSGTSDPLGCQ